MFYVVCKQFNPKCQILLKQDPSSHKVWRGRRRKESEQKGISSPKSINVFKDEIEVRMKKSRGQLSLCHRPKSASQYKNLIILKRSVSKWLQKHSVIRNIQSIKKKDKVNTLLIHNVMLKKQNETQVGSVKHYQILNLGVYKQHSNQSCILTGACWW